MPTDQNAKASQKPTLAAFARWYTALAVGIGAVVTQPVIMIGYEHGAPAAATAGESSSVPWYNWFVVTTASLLCCMVLLSIWSRLRWLPVVVMGCAIALAFLLGHGSEHAIPPAATAGITLCVATVAVSGIHGCYFVAKLLPLPGNR